MRPGLDESVVDGLADGLGGAGRGKGVEGGWWLDSKPF